MAQKKSFARRLARIILGFLVVCIALSVLGVVLLRFINPPFTAFMAQAQMEAWAKRDSTYVLRHRWVDLTRISPNLPLAVVASEDQKFPEHWGFDVEAIEKAYQLNQHSHRVHGASTISQQVAKNLFLWSGRSYFRKGLEAYFTLLIEASWPKRRILEIYLNIAEFGYGIYGAEAAAQRYFHVTAARLDAQRCGDSRGGVAQSSAAVRRGALSLRAQRRDWILGQMQALGGPEMLDDIDAYPNRRP